jgi:hypothetical protein
MNIRSSLPVMLMSAVGLLTLGFLVSCGGNTRSSSPSSATVGAPVSQTTTMQPPSAPAEVRLGCGSYCQNAGGYGSAVGAPKPPAVTILSSGTLTPEADGYVPLTVTCNRPVQCIGALLLCLKDPAMFSDPVISSGGMDTYCGRSDLLVDAGATRTFDVQLPARALAWVQSHGPTTFQLHADSAEAPGGGYLGDDDAFDHINTAELMVAAPG